MNTRLFGILSAGGSVPQKFAISPEGPEVALDSGRRKAPARQSE